MRACGVPCVGDNGRCESLCLVLDQSEQWRDDDCDAGAEDGGELVAEALAAAGGEEDEAVLVGERRLDRLALVQAEGRMAEDAPESVVEDGGRYAGG